MGAFGKFLIRFARRNVAGLFLLPAAVLLIIFYMVPLMVLLSTSLHPFVPGSLEASPEFTLENYGRVFSSVYLSTLVLTVRISLITAVFAVIMAYPLANYLVRSRSGRIRTFVMAFLIGSFFIQLLIRVYAFLHVFGGGGVVNQLLLFFGFDAIEWIGGEWPVTVSMVHQTIPLAVLVLMGSIKSINPEIEDAARVLGATGIQTFLRVTLPLSLPGIISSSVLAFAGATSAFVTPMILGGGRVMMIANYVYTRFTDAPNYPFASAMSFVLLVISLGVCYGMTGLISRWVKIR